ncbi:type I protein arginine methyltransferase [Fistulifera solaris]|uniref:type I protein arginine methyltransferase n=1 Tax=Fistulifera solaris TaxID=1519565 RepID=A0A1Z5JQZ6_FISSO|nr:type I protein arginine methyltransferase [Fistulifera solaris]|eukprot:GAX16444.1 type I protein arginine methyltransferase [Fistulifera solaris]
MNAQGEIPSFNGDEKAKATDFANYFCAYSQIYHQKSMLSDHQRMAAYHSAILGNQDVFRDKVVMDIGTGSGILSVWAAQAGARKVYAIEYTDMAKHAEKVMKANGVDHIVTVLQTAVEDVKLPIESDRLLVEEDGTERCVDIIISEWMGYMLLRESMMDSVIHARDRFLKQKTGLMFPSHTTLLLAPITDEEERKHAATDFSNAMADWNDFEQTTNTMYGVDMSILAPDYEREQKEYYMLSSRWTELPPEAVLAEPAVIKRYDMMTCTLQQAKGLFASDPESSFDFEIEGSKVQGPVSGFSGWFTADFCSRTDHGGVDAPKLHHPAFLSTGPENGYTHWGQQTFYFLSSIPTMKGETTRISGGIEMTRTKDNSRLYNCRFSYSSSRRKSDEPKDGAVLMKSGVIENVYQIP